MASGNYAGLALGRIILQFVAKTDEVDNALRNTHKGISELAVGIAKSGTAFLAFGATANQVFTRILDPMKESIKLANELNSTLNAVTNVMDKRGIDGAQGYVKSLKELSRTFGVDLKDSVKSFRTLIEAGIPDTAAVPTLQKAAVLARIGMTDLNTSVETFRTVINAWNLDVANAANQTKVLNGILTDTFRAFDFAAASPEEFQKNLGKSAAIAAEAGVSYQDLAATVSALSRAGLGMPAAFTAVNNMLLSFLKPTSKAQEETEKLNKHLGLTGDQALSLSGKFLKQNGLIGAVERFAHATGNSADELADLFSRKGAIVGVLGLLTDNFNGAHQAVELMRSSVGDLAVEFATMKDPMFKINQTMAQFQSISESVGKGGLPLIGDVLDKVNPLLEKFNKVLDDAPATMSGFSSAVLIFGTFGSAISQLLTQLGFLSFGLLALKGVFNSVIVSPAMSLFRFFWTDLAKDLEFITSRIEGLGGTLKRFFTGAGSASKEFKVFSSLADVLSKAFATNKAIDFARTLGAIDANAKRMAGSMVDASAAMADMVSDSQKLEEGAKALFKFTVGFGKFDKFVQSFGSLTPIVSAGPNSIARAFNAFLKSGGDAIQMMEDFKAEFSRFVELSGRSSDSIRDFSKYIEELIIDFNSLRSAYASGNGVLPAFADLQTSLTNVSLVSKEAFKDVKEGFATTSKGAAELEKFLKELEASFFRFGLVRTEFTKTAEAITKTLKEVGFAGSGGTGEAVINEWLKSIEVAASDSKVVSAFNKLFGTIEAMSIARFSKTTEYFTNFFAAIKAPFESIPTFLTSIGKGLDSMFVGMGKIASFSGRIALDFAKWELIINSVSQLFQIISQSVGLVGDILGVESGFTKLTDNTRLLLAQLAQFGVGLDQNSYAFIKNAESAARYAEVLRIVDELWINILKGIENFGSTAELAFAMVAKSITDLFGEGNSWSQMLEKTIQQLQDRIANADPQTPLTKSAIAWKEQLDGVIKKYDDIRTMLQQMVDWYKKEFEQFQKDNPNATKEQIQEHLRGNIEAMAAYYEQSKTLQSKETEERLKEFQKQALNKRQQLEAEIAMYNDYYDELKKREKSLQSELENVSKYKDQLTVGLTFANTPQAQQYYIDQLANVQKYIDKLKADIADTKRDALENELTTTEAIKKSWDDASVSVSGSVQEIADAVEGAGTAAAQASADFENLFQTWSAGLDDNGKTVIRKMLESMQQEDPILFEYFKTLGTDAVDKMRQSMMAAFTNNAQTWTKEMSQTVATMMGTTVDDIKKKVEELTLKDSWMGQTFKTWGEQAKTGLISGLDGIGDEVKAKIVTELEKSLGNVTLKDFIAGLGAGAATFAVTKSPTLATAATLAMVGGSADGGVGVNALTYGTTGAILGGKTFGTYGALAGAGIGAAIGTMVGAANHTYYSEQLLRLGFQNASPEMQAQGFDAYVAWIIANQNKVSPDLYAAALNIQSVNSYDPGTLSAYAKGGQEHMGGWAIVGEKGPELVNLPAGATVVPANKTKAMLQGSNIPAYANGTGNMQWMYANDQFIRQYLSIMGLLQGTPKWSAAYWYYMDHPEQLPSSLEEAKAQENKIRSDRAKGMQTTMQRQFRQAHPPGPYRGHLSSEASTITNALIPQAYNANPFWAEPGAQLPPLGTIFGADYSPDTMAAELGVPVHYYGIGSNYNTSRKNVNDMPDYQLGFGEHTRPRKNPYSFNNAGSATAGGAYVLNDDWTLTANGDTWQYLPQLGAWVPITALSSYLRGEMTIQELSQLSMSFGNPQEIARRQAMQYHTGPYVGDIGENGGTNGINQQQMNSMANTQMMAENFKAKYRMRDGTQVDAYGNLLDPDGTLWLKDRNGNFVNPITGQTREKRKFVPGDPKFAGLAESKFRINVNSGQYHYTRTKGTGTTGYGTRNEDTITSFYGDIGAIAKSGKFKGIKEFDAALGLWNQMSIIANKYGFSTADLTTKAAANYYTGPDGKIDWAKATVGYKPANMDDADVIRFVKLYKEALAYFAKAQDKLDKVKGAREYGGPINSPGAYLVGESGPEIVQLDAGTNVLDNKTISRLSVNGGSAPNMFSPSTTTTTGGHTFAQGGAFYNRGVIKRIPGRTSRYKPYTQANKNLPSDFGSLGGRKIAVIPNKRKKGEDSLGLLEAALRSAPMSKLNEFVLALSPSRGSSVLSFKKWTNPELVDYIINTMIPQSGIPVSSIYSMWKRISVQSSSNGNALNPSKNIDPSKKAHDGPIGIPTNYSKEGSRDTNDMPSISSQGSIISTDKKQSYPGTIDRRTDSKFRKTSGTKSYANTSAAREEMLRRISDMDYPSLVRLLKLLIGVDQANSVVGSMSREDLASYIINDVVKKKNVSTQTLSEYYYRAVKSPDIEQKPPVVQKPSASPMVGVIDTSMNTVGAFGGARNDYANTPEMIAGISGSSAHPVSQAPVNQVFQVGQVRTDEDIARIAMHVNGRIERARRRVS